MYKLDKYRVTIDVRLEPGFYKFYSESAAGKTYLASLLTNYGLMGEPVLSYSYVDFLRGLKLSDLLHTGLKIVLLDRLDMYFSKLSELEVNSIISIVDSTVILGDLKGVERSTNLPGKLCNLTRESTGLIKIG